MSNLRLEVAKSDVELSDRFTAALVYASELHRGQRRKVTGIPYISHLLSVAALVIESGGCEDSVIAALLHDAVEDQGGEATLADIRERFGEQVAEWVWACTARPMREGEDWRSHKSAYIEQIRASPLPVQRIVLADKVHNGLCLLANLAAAGETTWASFSGTRQDIIWLYQSLAQLLCCLPHQDTWMAQQLIRISIALKRHGFKC